MKLLIFGSTGSVGREVVKQAIAQGHTVTAFARKPAKLNIEHPNLKVAQGDATDFASVASAMPGQEAVVCVLGAGKQRTGTIRSEGTRQIVQAMEKAGVRRFICQSTLGAGDSRENLNFFWKHIMFRVLLKEVLADHERQEAAVKKSHLDWTIVRPAAFIEGPQTGKYRQGFSGTDKTVKLKISRPDVADFILKLLTSDASIHQTLSVSY